MSSFWSRFVHRMITQTVPSTEAEPAAESPPDPRPAAPPTPVPAAPNPRGLPPTSRLATPDDGAQRPRLFDPALRQFRSAFRPGDPKFADPEAAARWLELRRRATDHVLRRIAESPWGDDLVLRGSRLSRAWIGDEAREPGDLDWVVDPPSTGPSDRREISLFHGLFEAVFAPPGPTGVELVTGEVAIDDIWTYERAPGRRVVFPWRSPGLPGGAVQVDVVFGETLAEPARWESVPVADGGCVSIKVASPAQSLAWKLLWLETNTYAQGKDLYDAVLLAERFALPAAVLEQTLRLGGEGPMPSTAAEFVGDWDVDWDIFRAEYPWVVGDLSPWLARLVTALGPTFSASGRAESRPGHTVESDASPPRVDPPGPPWLTSRVVELARGIADDRAWDGLPILADALEEAGCDRDDLVGHCRANGPHVRGCWAIDLILGERRE
jgi:Nucleotidyl transferase AbiEii toxin, Type IV TA system